MKVLILDDERVERLLDLEAEADGRPRIKAARKTKPELPPVKELHAMARNGETPEVFERRREQLEALADAAERIRSELHELVGEAYSVGAGPAALARWSGYSARRIHQIANER